jgi:hypothetical protein
MLAHAVLYGISLSSALPANNFDFFKKSRRSFSDFKTGENERVLKLENARLLPFPDTT